MHQVFHLHSPNEVKVAKNPPKSCISSLIFFQSLRVSLFESFLISAELRECFQKVSATKFARLTEGFSPGDLKKAAADMEMKFSLLDSPSAPPPLAQKKKQINSRVEWLEACLAQSRQASCANWALEMQQPNQGGKTSLGWQDVGGLAQVRRSMLETLQWPAKVQSFLKRNFKSIFCKVHSAELVFCYCCNFCFRFMMRSLLLHLFGTVTLHLAHNLATTSAAPMFLILLLN